MKLSKPKKTESAHVRFPQKTKVAIEDQAAKNFRSFQDEVVALCAEALHARKYSISDYV
jgi:hypothetical protein